MNKKTYILVLVHGPFAYSKFSGEKTIPSGSVVVKTDVLIQSDEIDFEGKTYKWRTSGATTVSRDGNVEMYRYYTPKE